MGVIMIQSLEVVFQLKVLLAVCPNDKELDYKELEISNGGMASSALKK